MSENSSQQFAAGLMLGLFIIFCSLGCENIFEPLQKNEQAFSMYGSLDVHADTQWVRVMPVGKALLPTNSEPNGTIVTLIPENGGETVVLNDSLFRFGGDAYVWNYWTTQTLQPNAEYTLLSTTPEGNQSSATVTLPSLLPVPEVEYTEHRERGTVTGMSEDPIVTADMRFLVQALTEFGCVPETEVSISHLQSVFTYPNGEYRIGMNSGLLIQKALGTTGSYRVNRRELVIVSADEDWPDLSGLSPEEMVLPDIVSNVENGTGVIAGIATRKVLITPRREPC